MSALYRVLVRFATICALAALSAAAVAAAAVPIEATGDLEVWAIQHSSHSPCDGRSWHHTVAEGPLFVESGGIAPESCLDATWLLVSGETGLVYDCSLVGVPEWYEWGRYCWVGAQVANVLAVDAPTILTATRAVESGVVALTGHHDVVLTSPDGIVTSLFAADSTATTATAVLTPGTWRVAIDVQAELSHRNYMTYTGSVLVEWNGPVATERPTWGGLKSLYR